MSWNRTEEDKVDHDRKVARNLIVVSLVLLVVNLVVISIVAGLVTVLYRSYRDNLHEIVKTIGKDKDNIDVIIDFVSDHAAEINAVIEKLIKLFGNESEDYIACQ